MVTRCRVELSDAEHTTLEEMARHHKFRDVSQRALGVLAVARSRKPEEVAEFLGVSGMTVRNWVRQFNERGVAGLLGGHAGGAPRKLTPELVAAAVRLARDESLTLPDIAARLRAQWPACPQFTLKRLEYWLKQEGLSFKRPEAARKKPAARPRACQLRDFPPN